MTYGDYFLSSLHFLTRHLPAAIAALNGNPQPGPDIRDVDIHLVKHGAFYHPAKVTVRTDQDKILMALNVAAGRQGQSVMAVEPDNLNRLHQDVLDRDMVPRVLARGRGKVAGKPAVPMFAAQWFDGFCEFHLCRDPQCDEAQAWKVWDESGDWFLAPDQMAEVYRRAAFILTCCYNPLSFEAVLDWHHAAGDFIIKKKDRTMDVRLITIRRYAPLCDMPADNGITLTDVLDGLVLFLLDLTLGMRLDRLDGVSRMAWAGDAVLPAVWQGFNQGLSRMAEFRGVPPDFIAGVGQYLAAHSVDDLVGLGCRVEARFRHLPEESQLIHRHLPGHAVLLRDLIENHV